MAAVKRGVKRPAKAAKKAVKKTAVKRTGGATKSKGGGFKFRYQERDPSAVQKQANQSSGDYDKYISEDVKTWPCKEGDHRVRFLPPTWEDARHFAVELWVHYSIGPDNQSYLCLRKMKNERCPCCEESDAATRSGNSQLAKALKPKKRWLVYIVDRDDEKVGAQVWSMPVTVDKGVAKVSYDRRTGDMYAIDHPDEGWDIDFEREGSDQHTTYLGFKVAKRASPISDDPDEQARILQFIVEHPLPDILKFYDYDHIKGVFSAEEVDEDDADGEADDNAGFDVGDRVEVKDKTGDWIGTVTSIDDDGTLFVEWDDDGNEYEIDPSNAFHIDAEADEDEADEDEADEDEADEDEADEGDEDEADEELAVGLVVAVSDGENDDWFGVITEIYDDGTADVQSDADEEIYNVDVSFISTTADEEESEEEEESDDSEDETEEAFQVDDYVLVDDGEVEPWQGAITSIDGDTVTVRADEDDTEYETTIDALELIED